MTFINKKKNLTVAAAKTGMDEKTARKYRKQGKLPSQLKKEHIWRTRKDPFEVLILVQVEADSYKEIREKEGIYRRLFKRDKRNNFKEKR